MAKTKGLKDTGGLKANGSITKANAKELGRRGGLKSGQNKRDRRTLKEALRELLSEEYKAGSGVSWLEAICRQAVAKSQAYGDVRDLKVLAELLGEMQADTYITSSQVLNIQTSEGGRELISSIIKGDGHNVITDDKSI